MNITIIGYKCNGTDSVMGCVQDRVDSDMEIWGFSGKDALDCAAAKYAEMAEEPPYSRYMSHDWELTILYNGLESDDAMYDGEGEAIEGVHEAIMWMNEKIKDYCDAIKEERQKAADAAKKKAASAAKRRATLAKKKKEAAERAQFEALKAKYGDA